MSDNFKILMSGTLDKTNTRNTLNADIDKIKGQIKHIELNAKLSKSSLTAIKQQLSDLNNQNIDLSISPTSKNNFNEKGKQAGQDFSYAFNKASNLKLSINDDEIITKTKTVINQMDALMHRAEKSGVQLSADNLQKFDNLSGMVDSLKDVKQLREYLALARSEYQKLNALMSADIPDSAIEKMNTNIKGMPSNIQQINTSFSKLREPTLELQNKINNLATDYQKLIQLDDVDDIDKKIELYNKLTDNIKLLKKEITTTLQAEKLMPMDFEVGKVQYKIEDWMRNNTRAAKHFNKELDEMLLRLKTADAQELKKINGEFNALAKQADSMSLSGKTLFETLKHNAAKFTGWFGISQAVMAGTRAIKDMVAQVKILDTSMIELKKVTDETDATYNKFLTNTAQKAKDLGTSMSDFVESTANFARLGYSLEDASQLAEVATLYRNVGDGISVDDASSSIISTMKAFNIEAEDSIGIIDRFNEVGNNFAISSAGIGDALQRSASALSSANNTLDESIALITAGNTVVQNPEQVGTALKTLSLRLRSTSAEIEQMGEDTEGALETTSKLRQLLLDLTDQKVDIQLDEDTYKSTYQIMLDISKVMDDMTDMEQATALEAMFGKRLANVGASILQNMAEAEDVLATSLESSGSAMEEQMKYQEGIQYSLDRLTASMQEMAHVTLDSSTIKFFVDLMNGIVETTSAIGGLVPIIATVGAVAGVTKIAMSALLTSTEKKTIATLAATVAEYGLATSIKATSVAIKSLMLTNPVGWLLLGVSAVAGLTMAFNHLNKASEETIQKAREIKEEFESSEKTFKSNKETLKGLEDEFKTLAAGVDENGKNISLSAEQYERYQDIVQQIIGMSPELIVGYDAEGKALVRNNTLLEDAIALQKELNEQKKQEYLSSGEDIFDGYRAQVDKIKKELSIVDLNIVATGGKYKANSMGDPTGIWGMYEDLELPSLKDEVAFYKEIVKLGDTFILQATQKYDLSKEQQESLRNQITLIEKEITQIDNASKSMQSYLSIWASSRDNSDWYSDIQSGYLDEFNVALQDFAADPNMSLNEMKEATSELGKSFVAMQDKIPTDEIEELKTQLADGTIAEEEFNQKLTEQIAIIESLASDYPELANLINSIAQGYRDFANIEFVAPQLDNSASLKTQSKAIDDFQKSIQTVGKALSDLNKLDSSSIVDLMQEFSDFNWGEFGVTGVAGVGDLEGALRALGQELLNNVDVSDEFRDALQAIFDEAMIGSIADLLSNVAATESAVYSLNQEILENGKISLNTINSLMSSYPQLTQVLEGYINGLYTEKEVLEALSDQYDVDVAKYKNATIAKLDTSKQFYNEVYKGNSTAIQELAKTYNLDYRNWHSLAQAKLSVESELIRKLSSAWSRYYSVVKNAAGTYAPQVKLDNMLDSDGQLLVGSSSRRGQVSTGQMDRNYLQAKKQAQEVANLANQAISDLNKIAGLNLSLPSTGDIISGSTRDWYDSNSKKSGSDKKDSTDYYLESFKELLAQLQFQRDMDLISEKQYLDALNTLNNQYFKGKSQYLDEYRQYEVEVYQGLKRLEEQRLSDLLRHYDNRLSVIQATQEEIEYQIDLLESQNSIVGAGFYNQLIANAQQQISLLNQEKREIQSLFNKQLSSGFIKSGTEEYYEFVSALNDIESQIRDLTLQTVQWGNAVEDVFVDVFDNLIDNVEHLNSELSTLYDLLGSKKLTDSKGFTKEGIAAIGLLAQQMEAAQFKAKHYAEEIERLSANYKKNEELIEDLREAQLDEIRTTQSLRDAIVDLNRERVNSIKEGLDEEYNAYRKVIQAKKDDLDSEIRLHDYKKRIAERETDVIDLRRQLTTLELDESDEGRVRSALLREKLAQAERALEEEQYRHSIEAQKEALDQQLEDYKEKIDEKILTLEEYLENENQVIADSLELAKSNASSVATVIANLAVEHGFFVSDAIVNPWFDGINAIASYGDALSTMSSRFTGELSKMTAEMDKLLKQANNMSSSFTGELGKMSAEMEKLLKQINNMSKTTVTVPKVTTPTTSTNSSSKLPLSTVKYQGNKKNLNINTSIVDRLKYNDLDSSIGARGTLYKHFGGSGTYSGTASQNTWLIQKLKQHGFKKGGEIGNLINQTGEDGFVLAKSGESIMSRDATKLFKDSLPQLNNLFNNLANITTNIPATVNNKSKGLTVNLNYDKLINVEGNVDKDFTQEFTRLGTEISNQIKDDFYEIGKKWLRKH